MRFSPYHIDLSVSIAIIYIFLESQIVDILSQKLFYISPSPLTHPSFQKSEMKEWDIQKLIVCTRKILKWSYVLMCPQKS